MHPYSEAILHPGQTPGSAAGGASPGGIRKGRGWAAEPSPGETATQGGVAYRNRPPEPQPGVFLFSGLVSQGADD
jgi:hypothetical protein